MWPVYVCICIYTIYMRQYQRSFLSTYLCMFMCAYEVEKSESLQSDAQAKDQEADVYSDP